MWTPEISSELLFWELPISKFANYIGKNWIFSDFKYILSLDKEYPMSHKYFIRKIKACELVLRIRCHGFKKKKCQGEVEFQKENQWGNSE